MALNCKKGHFEAGLGNPFWRQRIEKRFLAKLARNRWVLFSWGDSAPINLADAYSASATAAGLAAGVRSSAAWLAAAIAALAGGAMGTQLG